MMVTFISQCEKKALKRTRCVLDAFANRIGDNAWQTVITQEGLNAVKMALQKTASKSTAISCHWQRSRSRSDLLWVVGKREKFNYEGMTPVNTTIKNIANRQWENDWHYMPLIRAIVSLAALFHDWGKGNVCFQKKLKKKSPSRDPLRHEWVSCLLFHAFCESTNDTKEPLNDEQWLKRLIDKKIDEKLLKKTLKDNKTPLKDLPLLATMVSWIILTHHLLPKVPKDKFSVDEELHDYKKLLKDLDSRFGYKNTSSESKPKDCLSFEKGLLINSSKWLNEISKRAKQASQHLALLEGITKNGVWRIILFYSRLSLMLGDHNFSSRKADEKWDSPVDLLANTKKEGKGQKLDEHLVGVSKDALAVTHHLAQFEHGLPNVANTKEFQKRSPEKFKWQNKAIDQIAQWKKKNQEDGEKIGFFSINMASTGKGKTLANARIMYELSNENSFRYILALGLRTLTLQTGTEYRKRLKISEEDIAVLIGSKAVSELYNQNQDSQRESSPEHLGSESMEELLPDGYLETNNNHDCRIEGYLKTVLKTPKDRQLLYAPLLVCTIDHIMGATETIRGGRYILPSLRLMSSDLVIDEVDDFDTDDLKAMGRLIHLAGMLGRKVMISSATIPPDLAKGFFHAYHQGWILFSESRGIPSKIGLSWIDEFKTNVETFNQTHDFSSLHDKFVKSRVKKLKCDVAQRKAEVIGIETIKVENDGGVETAQDDDSLEKNFFRKIKASVIQMHKYHFIVDDISKKQVSFGIVRMANVKPCVQLTKYFLDCQWRNDIAIRTMAYHGQQVLLMRNEQEKHLDAVLNRKNPQEVFKNPIIKDTFLKLKRKMSYFILVTTPVEEIGRDHDFDWAVIEPSSYRSIIQLAGRVLRHRDTTPTNPNIGIMQYNLKGYKQECSNHQNGKKRVFYNPGYETKCPLFSSHSIKELVNEEQLKNIDAHSQDYTGMQT